jgi:hypothetical protein
VLYCCRVSAIRKIVCIAAIISEFAMPTLPSPTLQYYVDAYTLNTVLHSPTAKLYYDLEINRGYFYNSYTWIYGDEEEVKA